MLSSLPLLTTIHLRLDLRGLGISVIFGYLMGNSHSGRRILNHNPSISMYHFAQRVNETLYIRYNKDSSR